MKKILIILIVLFGSANSYTQKIISNCTITFTIKSLKALNINHLGSKIVYIKGKDVRIDLLSNGFRQTIFYNSNTESATILKYIGESKYILHYNAEEWKKQNDINEGIITSFLTGTKKILDYDCKQAQLKLKNGNIYTVYYTPSIIPSITENQYEFKDVPGLVLEYESLINGNQQVVFTADKINFNPVPALLFEIPRTGYRILH